MGCKFMIVDVKNGMGNKFFIMVLVFVYVVFIQCVFFISEFIGVFDLMCELFFGFLWRFFEDIVSYSVLIWNEI